FRLFVLLVNEGTRPRRDHFAQVEIVLLERLFRVDDHVDASERGKEWLPRMLQHEPHREAVDRFDPVDDSQILLVHARDIGRWFDNPLEGRYGVVGREWGPIGEVEAVADLERVGAPVGRYVPTLRQLRDDGR